MLIAAENCEGRFKGKCKFVSALGNIQKTKQSACCLIVSID